MGRKWKPLKMKAITLEGTIQIGHLLMNSRLLALNLNLLMPQRRANRADVCKSVTQPPRIQHQVEELAKVNPLKIVRNERKCKMLRPLADIETKRRPRKIKLMKKNSELKETLNGIELELNTIKKLMTELGLIK